MTKTAIAKRLAEIESELRRLRAELARAPDERPEGTKTFNDLYGVTRGDRPLTFEEIQQAEYRVADAPQ